MKTYSVKEIRDITGLTWKQLYEYKKGIPGIGPMNDAGYKQYSKDDLEKLVQAALMAKLGAKPKRINDVFSDEKYDRKKVLIELQNEAQKRLVEAQDIITVTEALGAVSDQYSYFSSFAMRDLHILAENLRYSMHDKDVQLLEEYIDKEGEIKIFAEVGKLKDIEEDDIGNKKTNTLVRKLKKYGEKEIGVNGNRFLMILYGDLKAIDDVRKEVENAFGIGKADIIADAIGMYQGMEFFSESIEDMIQLHEYIGEDYEDEDVREYIYRIKNSVMKNFGLKTTFEFLNAIDSIRYFLAIDENLSDDERKDGGDVINYIVGAIRYYEG